MSAVDQIDGKIEAEGELYLSKQFWKRLEETLSESPIFDELEKILQEPEPLDWYSIREFPLDVARNDEMIMGFPKQGGDIILVISYTGKAEIKFDNANSDSFDLEVYSKIRHTYTDIYLSNEAQPGDTIKILFGRGDWEITDTVTEIGLSGTISNDYLDPITDPLKIGQIIRDGHIVPHADIACEKILLSGATRLDQWRSTEDYTYMDPGRILIRGATTLSDWRHPTDLTLINGGQIFTHSIEANKLSILTHILTGATWVDNSPAAGWVAWSDAQITYNGNTYNITDGNTNQAYIWWDFSLSTTTFQTANIKPALTDDDCIVCYNDAGTHELVWNATLIEGRTIRTGSVDTDELTALAVTTEKLAVDAVIAEKINVVGLDGVTGRIVVGDATDADEVTVGVNAFATTLILPGKIIISGGTNLEDWRAAGDLTMIDGGDIFANSVTALQIAALTITGAEIFGNTITANKLNITDLVDIANLLTVAAGRIVIGADALGPGLDGIFINDGVRNRAEIGEVAAGVWAANFYDATGVLVTDRGQVTQRWQKIRETDITVATQFWDVDGLDGNTDKMYYIWAKFVRGGAAAAMNYGVRPNADAGAAAYSFQTVYGIAGVPGASINNAFNHMWMGRADNPGELSQGESYIAAETGTPRMALTLFSAMVGAGGNFGRGYVGFTTWHDVAANIISLRVWAEVAAGIGVGSHIEVWRRVE